MRGQFEDSPVELVGLGSACEYHSPDPDVVRRNIEETREFVRLCRDVGGSGVKVRPNGLPEGVPAEQTLEEGAVPDDILGAMSENRRIWRRLIAG